MMRRFKESAGVGLGERIGRGHVSISNKNTVVSYLVGVNIEGCRPGPTTRKNRSLFVVLFLV